MSSRDRIAEILAHAQAAAQPTPGPERSLASQDHGARRAAILTEIDETMLARALEFRIGDHRLTLEARGRRLLRATRVTPDDGAPAALRGRLAAGGLKPAEEAALLAELIHHFAAAEGALTVRPAPSDLPPSVVEKGHAAADLAAAAPELAAAPPAAPTTPPAPDRGVPTDLLRALHDGCAPFARSGALADGEGRLLAAHGDNAAALLAQDLARGRAVPGAMLDAALPGAKLIVLGSAEADALCLCAASGATLAARIAASDLSAAVGAWRAARG